MQSRLKGEDGPIDPWGGPDRYYARSASEGSPAILDAHWQQAIERASPNSRATVQRTVRLWNQRVRNQLKDEIGFRLKRRQVPVRVADGLPLPLYDYLQRATGVGELMLNRSLLRAVVDGTRFMESVREHVTDADGRLVGPAGPRDIRVVRETAEAWLRLVDHHDLGQALRQINEDVLGAYFPVSREVEVYWQAIGIVSAIRGIPLEGLAVVVLAHELAHAYTHIGYDIDDYDWPTKQFSGTDSAIVEGLAQFYTEVVCTNLKSDIPDAIDAFTALLGCQAEVYRTHKTWVTDRDPDSGEIVRVSLVECRRSSSGMHRAEFADAVKRHREEIESHRRSEAWR